MYISQASNAVINGANQFHIHHYLSKNQKFIILTKGRIMGLEIFSQWQASVLTFLDLLKSSEMNLV